MASPRPVPPKRLLMLASPWEKGSKSLFACSSVMPMPVSSMVKSRRQVEAFRAFIRTSKEMVPDSVNLAALLMRLMRICSMRLESPKKKFGSLGSLVRLKPILCSSIL